MRIFTVGHSNRSLQDFVALLRQYEVDLLVDIRRYPGSRRHPHFKRRPLGDGLRAAGIDYGHAGHLGGMREESLHSPHTAWAEAGFRAYAEHMDSDIFRETLAKVVTHTRTRTVALMCAEATPDHCHRQLTSDALLVRGLEVVHILAPGETRAHTLHAAAVVDGDRIAYPAPEPPQGELF